MKSFCYLGVRLNASGRGKAVVTVKTRIRWSVFRECVELLHEKNFC